MPRLLSTVVLVRSVFLLLVFCWTGSAVRAEDHSEIKCPSPDGRFALRITDPKEPNSRLPKVDVIKQATGEVVIDLEIAHEAYRNNTILVWSSDSRSVAYVTRGDEAGETRVYFWNGSGFDAAKLPDDLPSPRFRSYLSSGDVKNYGGAVTPLRWLKSGELELSNDLTLYSRQNGKTYTGVIIFTLKFDSQHRASIGKVGKTKTTVKG